MSSYVPRSRNALMTAAALVTSGAVLILMIRGFAYMPGSEEYDAVTSGTSGFPFSATMRLGTITDTSLGLTPFHTVTLLVPTQDSVRRNQGNTSGEVFHVVIQNGTSQLSYDPRLGTTPQPNGSLVNWEEVLPATFRHEAEELHKLIDLDEPYVDTEFVQDLVASGVITSLATSQLMGRDVKSLVIHSEGAPSGFLRTTEAVAVTYDVLSGLRLASSITDSQGSALVLDLVAIDSSASVDSSVTDLSAHMDFVEERFSSLSLDDYRVVVGGGIPGLSIAPSGTITSGAIITAPVVITSTRSSGEAESWWMSVQSGESGSGNKFDVLHSTTDTWFMWLENYDPWVWSNVASPSDAPNTLSTVSMVTLLNGEVATVSRLLASLEGPGHPYQFIATWFAPDTSVRVVVGGDWGFASESEFVQSVNEYLAVAVTE